MRIIKVAQHKPDHITVLALRRRFTIEERQAIELAAQSSIEIRVFLEDLAAATSTYVSLSDESITTGIATLVAATFLTQERADTILGTPIEDAERP